MNFLKRHVFSQRKFLKGHDSFEKDFIKIYKEFTYVLMKYTETRLKEKIDRKDLCLILEEFSMLGIRNTGSIHKYISNWL